jgi:hypothetical protein
MLAPGHPADLQILGKCHGRDMLTLVWNLWTNYANSRETTATTFCRCGIRWLVGCWLHADSQQSTGLFYELFISWQNKLSSDNRVMPNKCLKPLAGGHPFLHVRKLENLNTAIKIIPFCVALWHDGQNMSVSYNSQCTDLEVEAGSHNCTSWIVFRQLRSIFRVLAVLMFSDHLMNNAL